jgi:RimJ/RimL family protein N-acetyltransferase
VTFWARWPLEAPLTTPEITVRPLTAADIDRFLAWEGPAFGPPGRDFLATAAQNHYRPHWTWVAERDGRVVARAAWWGAPDDEHPIALDWFDLGGASDRVAVGAHLLQAAAERVRTEGGGFPEYHLFLPADWHDRADVRRAVDERTDAAGQAGLRPFVERLRVEWLAASGLPAEDDRLTFAPAADDGQLLDVLERVNVGTLDAYARRDIERHGPAGAARIQLDDMAWMPAPREWWRLASDADGALVGVVMPSRNYEAFVVGYIGVVPEQRGRGYVRGLLADATTFLAGAGAARIVADTDTGNGPMAAAFGRAGYRVTARRIVMT